MAKKATTKSDPVREFREIVELQAASRSKETWGSAKKREWHSDVKSSGVVAARRHSTEEDEDRFGNLYGLNGLLEPPYHPIDQWRIYEECGTLLTCITSLTNNTERPHTWVFNGAKDSDKDLAENVAIRTELDDFFRRVNEKESFLDLRKKIKKDRCATGNAYVEVLRNADYRPERLYYIPSTHMRVTALDQEDTDVVVKMPRAGKLIDVVVPRRMRRFCRMDRGSAEQQWFKELGDPRVVDHRTGEYVKDSKGNYLIDVESDYEFKATEIWWLKDGWAGNAYGIPFWTPALWDIRGSYLARWVNFDHLDQGAIAPFAFVPTGGKISETSRKEFERSLEEMRDPAYYNRIPVLNIEPDMNFDLNRGASAAQTKLEVVKLRDSNNEDFMFGRYLVECEDAIRKTSLLPPLYTGNVKEYSSATAYAAMEVAESQVFEPARTAFDEEVNITLIMNEFGVYQWSFKSQPTKIGDKETFYRSVRIWGTVGGPSMNQLIALGNEVFGTSWNQLEGDLYNLPASIVMALTGGGQTTIDENGKFVMAPRQEAGNPMDLLASLGGDEEPAKPEDAPADEAELKDDEIGEIFRTRKDDAAALLEIMERIEKRGYEPTTWDEAANAI